MGRGAQVLGAGGGNKLSSGEGMQLEGRLSRLAEQILFIM